VTPLLFIVLVLPPAIGITVGALAFRGDRRRLFLVPQAALVLFAQ